MQVLDSSRSAKQVDSGPTPPLKHPGFASDKRRQVVYLPPPPRPLSKQTPPPLFTVVVQRLTHLHSLNASFIKPCRRDLSAPPARPYLFVPSHDGAALPVRSLVVSSPCVCSQHLNMLNTHTHQRATCTLAGRGKRRRKAAAAAVNNCFGSLNKTFVCD